MRFSRGMDRFDEERSSRPFHPDAVIAAGDFAGGPTDQAHLGHAGCTSTVRRDFAQPAQQRLRDIDGDEAHSRPITCSRARNRDETNWLAGMALPRPA